MKLFARFALVLTLALSATATFAIHPTPAQACGDYPSPRQAAIDFVRAWMPGALNPRTQGVTYTEAGATVDVRYRIVSGGSEFSQILMMQRDSDGEWQVISMNFPKKVATRPIRNNPEPRQ